MILGSLILVHRTVKNYHHQFPIFPQYGFWFASQTLLQQPQQPSKQQSSKQQAASTKYSKQEVIIQQLTQHSSSTFAASALFSNEKQEIRRDLICRFSQQIVRLQMSSFFCGMRQAMSTCSQLIQKRAISKSILIKGERTGLSILAWPEDLTFCNLFCRTSIKYYSSSNGREVHSLWSYRRRLVVLYISYVQPL